MPPEARTGSLSVFSAIIVGVGSLIGAAATYLTMQDSVKQSYFEHQGLKDNARLAEEKMQAAIVERDAARADVAQATAARNEAEKAAGREREQHAAAERRAEDLTRTVDRLQKELAEANHELDQLRKTPDNPSKPAGPSREEPGKTPASPAMPSVVPAPHVEPAKPDAPMRPLPGPSHDQVVPAPKPAIALEPGEYTGLINGNLPTKVKIERVDATRFFGTIAFGDFTTEGLAKISGAFETGEGDDVESSRWESAGAARGKDCVRVIFEPGAAIRGGVIPLKYYAQVTKLGMEGAAFDATSSTTELSGTFRLVRAGH